MCYNQYLRISVMEQLFQAAGRLESLLHGSVLPSTDSTFAVTQLDFAALFDNQILKAGKLPTSSAEVT